MADTPLYTLHPRPLTTLFAELEAYARAQSEVFVGTAGTVLERTNASGFRFYAHQSYDALGQKRERYLAGPAGNADADAAAEGLRSRIAELKTILPSLRLLGREGFQLTDARAWATLAALHNRGLFAGGAVLVGSHAYGVLLNRLGVRAASYATEDVDVGRAGPLDLESPLEGGLKEVLRESGMDFVEVPQLSVRAPSTSFKQRGRSTFQVDLLAPARGESFGSVPVPELRTRAQTLPYLGYLLEESQVTAVLAREGACTVRVPLPERFAVHKLIVSALRAGRDAKALKDRSQAAVLSAALAELHPGALGSALRELPRAARKPMRRALAAIREDLSGRHPRAWQELNGEATEK
jgi:hypothetical protein